MGEFLLTGKRTSTQEYRISGRGTKGVINILTTERNGLVVASFAAKMTIYVNFGKV